MERLNRGRKLSRKLHNDTLYVKDCEDPEGLRLILDYPDHDSSVPDFSRMTKRQFIDRYIPGWTEEELAY